MEQNVNVWKANLTNGLIMGLIGIVYSLVIYFLDLSLNKVQGYVFMVILLVVLFFLVKSFRDNYMHGMITFGQSLGAGLIIFLYYSIIMALFTYILYAVIDPDLTGKMLAAGEEAMLKKGMPQTQIDAGMAIQAKIMKPAFMALMGILSSMFTGFIISLLVAAFVRKEGNPLVDSTVQ
ncbi:MAG: DUF4199 domain-containing protein [Bacteroidales bacterium]|jgi:hypothetical protein|nr:DUF4199 domain-containing protein [Bacteroidales bacterium]